MALPHWHDCAGRHGGVGAVPSAWQVIHRLLGAVAKRQPLLRAVLNLKTSAWSYTSGAFRKIQSRLRWHCLCSGATPYGRSRGRRGSAPQQVMPACCGFCCMSHAGALLLLRPQGCRRPAGRVISAGVSSCWLHCGLMHTCMTVAGMSG